MKIKSSAFRNGQISLDFGQFATKEFTKNDLPQISFDIEWDISKPESKYIHFLFVDHDSIPVVGMSFIHWSVANIELEKYKDGLPLNASLFDKSLIQSTNSMIFNEEIDNESAYGFIGCMPPNETHTYTLIAWTTNKKLDLKNGYYVNEFIKELNKEKHVEQTKLEGTYPHKL